MLCPTRNNPEGFSRMVGSVCETSSKADVIAWIDIDQTEMYRSGPARVHYGDRIGPIASVNRLAGMHPGYDAYGFLTDDAEVKTAGWDVWMLEAIAALPKRLGVVSPYWAGAPQTSFPFVTESWINTTGWMAYPRCYHFCWDTIVEILAEPIGLIRATKEQFEVEHPNHTSSNLMDHFAKDSRSFLFWAVRERREMMDKLKAAAR